MAFSIISETFFSIILEECHNFHINFFFFYCKSVQKVPNMIEIIILRNTWSIEKNCINKKKIILFMQYHKSLNPSCCNNNNYYCEHQG